MLNRSEILIKAWADYRRDEFKGWGVRRGEPFNRKHFGYCLRMAWEVAKELAARTAMPAPTPKPAKILTKAQVARAEAIRAEMFDMQMGDFIPWSRHAALSAELAGIS